MSRRRAARVVVLLVVAGAVRCAAQGGSSNLGGESSHPHRPSHTYVHDLPVTSDRCVVYTYYAPLKGAAHHSWAPDAIHQWRRSWSGAGWKPRVLTPAHARAHPEHDALEAFVKTLPTPNARDYESACFLRHLAVAVVGGGYLSDYDVVNVNLPPPPHCDWLPNDGELTTHEGTGIPSIVSGDAKAFETFVRRVMAIDVREVMRAVNTPGLVSDMVVTIYLASLTPEVGGREGFVGRPAACVVLRVTLFARRGGGTFEGEALSLSREMKRWSDDARRGREALVGGVHARSTVFTTPERVRQPPCDDRGVEVTPLVFHISNEVVLNYFGNAHRPSVMARWYDNLTVGQKQRLHAIDSVRTRVSAASTRPLLGGVDGWNGKLISPEIRHVSRFKRGECDSGRQADPFFRQQ